MGQYEDRVLSCVEKTCGQQFVFTAGEQEFYAKKGFKEEPKRCKACREKRKAARTQRQDSNNDVEQSQEFWEQDRPVRARRRG